MKIFDINKGRTEETKHKTQDCKIFNIKYGRDDEIWDKTPGYKTYDMNVGRADKIINQISRNNKFGRMFKKNLIGFLNISSIKSSDEIANFLFQSGVVYSLDEGKKVVPILDGESISCDSFGISYFDEIQVNRICDSSGMKTNNYKLKKIVSHYNY